METGSGFVGFGSTAWTAIANAQGQDSAVARRNLEYLIERYWRPEEFTELEAVGADLGLEVFAGPFVRSSYRAEEAYVKVVGGHG